METETIVNECESCVRTDCTHCDKCPCILCLWYDCSHCMFYLDFDRKRRGLAPLRWIMPKNEPETGQIEEKNGKWYPTPHLEKKAKNGKKKGKNNQNQTALWE